MSSNRIKNIAIIGAAGRVGRHFTSALLATNSHTITALTRFNSPNTSTLPSGVLIREIDYEDPATLVAALTDQDALIITLPTGPADVARQNTLFKAAADAHVPWVFPNEYGYPLGLDTGLDVATSAQAKEKAAARREIERLGVSSWVSYCSGFWFEFSLGGTADRFGFDLAQRKLTLIDGGDVRVSTSTWAQTGRGMARLLSLPVEKEGEGVCLREYARRGVCVASFTVTQKEMWESVRRVTGTEESEWTVTYEDAKERAAEGLERAKKGDVPGLVRWVYSGVLARGGPGDMEEHFGLQNDALGLSKEDLDDCTKVVVEGSE